MNARTRPEDIALARDLARVIGRAFLAVLNVAVLGFTVYVLGARIDDAADMVLAFLAAAFVLSGGFTPGPRRTRRVTVQARPYAARVAAPKDGTP